MSFKIFAQHFIDNKEHFQDLDWSRGILTEEEKKLVSSSIQQFQKWESSEWKHLIKFADELWDCDYTEAVISFIKEEQVHAIVLEKFMKNNNIERISSHWVDSVFRFLRKIFSLENSVMVLLTAEIIAAVYYDALLKATGSKTLQSICKQILADESVHINFQSVTLKEFYMKHNKIRRFLSRTNHKMLMVSTIFIVWIYHKKVFIWGGYSLRKFYYSVMQEFKRSEKIILT